MLASVSVVLTFEISSSLFLPVTPSFAERWR
nr:MAG TPA: hypothetical protein [Caudoviricetes sp.]